MSYLRLVLSGIPSTLTAVQAVFSKAIEFLDQVPLLAALAMALALPMPSQAQTAISPGENNQGTVLVGQTNAWSFTAGAGERVILQIGKVSGGAGFTPRLELFAPNGGRIGSKAGSVAARLDIQTSAAGTYLAVVSDANQSGTGSYRIQLAKLPGTFTVLLSAVL